MKKKIFAFITAAILVFCTASLVFADVESASLTLQYKRGDVCYSGLEIKTYHVAHLTSNKTYELTDAFKDYPVVIDGITSKAEWNSVTEAIFSYIVSDDVSPDHTAVTDEFGSVKFDNIPAGLYLTASVKVESDGKYVLFESFITAVPGISDGKYVYDVTASPKSEEHTPTHEDTEYKLIKLWRDTGCSEERPHEVEFDVLKNGVYSFTAKLNADNNWSYTWTAPDDGSEWNAVEKNVPTHYTVSSSQNGRTITFTNTCDCSEPSHDDPGYDGPVTGDTTQMWPWIAVMCFSGALMIIGAVWYKRIS